MGRTWYYWVPGLVVGVVLVSPVMLSWRHGPEDHDEVTIRDEARIVPVTVTRDGAPLPGGIFLYTRESGGDRVQTRLYPQGASSIEVPVRAPERSVRARIAPWEDGRLGGRVSADEMVVYLECPEGYVAEPGAARIEPDTVRLDFRVEVAHGPAESE
jgi:hypothetical protein